MPEKISEDNRKLYQYVTAALGGGTRVTRFWDEAERSHVDILVTIDQPCKGVNSYSTLGLSDTPLQKDGKKFGVRVELLGACGAQFEKFPNALSTAAFNVINSGWFCAPAPL